MSNIKPITSNEQDRLSRATNPILDPSLRMINGPINVVRLEGVVNGIPKVIYLFMDIHNNVRDQTECRNIFSQDVQKYFVDTFRSLGGEPGMYDFFVEIYPSELNGRRSSDTGLREPKERYIEEVVKVFQKIFNYDPRRNKVTVNEMFDHVRLHYLDIRDYYKGSMLDASGETVGIASRFMREDYVSSRELMRIIDLLAELKDYIKLVIDILTHPAPPGRSSSKPKVIGGPGSSRTGAPKQDREAMQYLANKLHYVYNHANVKREVSRLLDQSIRNFQSLVKTYDKTIQRFYSYVEQINKAKGRLTAAPRSTYLFNYGLDPVVEREMIVDIATTVDLIHNESFVEYFARFTDVYFLRRFIDKDYITNAVVYTGSLHSNTYIHFLVNRFNFKVTHASYSLVSNMGTLTKRIKEIGLMETQELFLPPIHRQCSDITDFPEHFA